ncbi:MAG: EAL domain-containing protein [Natronospirillum sp.]|uniref:bifunctional diguanylate cyclase/phosphodiesterase n=1 Tax=Natronospirillum sp. TaxID=2812955 RepID=UPI0025E5B3F6|nr:EAL domain-containing protein [Natronospirillum sp.]MCH8553429.1 EAL domain-containing protein [Natronospirillum sp.]
MLLGEDNCIEACFGPSLPEAYNKAFIGLEIGPNVGSCGTAMYRRETVVVTDISSDPLWESSRATALQYGLTACWSTPIMTPQGNVLGSFAVYRKEVASPSPRQLELVSGAVYLAGIAIERHRAEARIQYMAHHDHLTGLPNRTFLMEQVEKAIKRAGTDDSRIALLMVDLDRFKDVNDSLGHHTGDLLLQEVAERLSSAVRSGDIVARLGGDEFVLALPELKDTQAPSSVAQKVLDQLSEPFHTHNQAFQLGASIGISVYPEDGHTAQELLRTADTAMYAAKKEGRGHYQYFTHALNQAAHERMALLSQLQQAIRNSEFLLHYQPLYCLRTGELRGAEALLRWQHPQRGLLYPGQFLYLLEEHGLMVEVGSRVLEAACLQAGEWQKAGLPPIRLAVNVAADQLYRGDLMALVQQCLRHTGLEPGRLMLEFTETVLLKHSDAIISSMRGLKKMGVRLALDDFGTGYSSLSYLHRFPVDQLKIDQSFIQGLEKGGGTLPIVQSIVQLAETLGLQAVAEGLETETQQKVMTDLGCPLGQGFYLGYPVSAEEFTALLQTVPTQGTYMTE